MGRVAAIFDFDGTLVAGYSILAFLKERARRREIGAVASLEPATKLLREGISILVAPEGTRVAGTDVGEFEKGAFRMAMAAKVPVVPIVIRNVDDIGSRTSGTMRPGTVDVAVLPPIRVERWTRRDLERRIAGVRGLFVQTLQDWPRPAAARKASRR